MLLTQTWQRAVVFVAAVATVGLAAMIGYELGMRGQQSMGFYCADDNCQAMALEVTGR